MTDSGGNVPGSKDQQDIARIQNVSAQSLPVKMLLKGQCGRFTFT